MMHSIRGLALFVAALLSMAAQAEAPLYSIAPPAAEQIEQLRTEAGPRQAFALRVPVELDSLVDGAWEAVQNERIWRASLDAPGALSLHLVFEALNWPADAALTVSSHDGRWSQTYTQENLSEGMLHTLLTPASRLQMIWRLPAEAPAARLRLKSAYYGVSDPYYSSKHGSCNNDTACFDNPSNANAIDSTVLLLINEGSSGFACSGLLVNNVRNDRTPYILTADHCGITRANDAAVQVFWRYEDSSCGNAMLHGHPDPDGQFGRVGVELLADGSRSDFTLLILGSAAKPGSIPSDFQPYWSGWNVTASSAQSGLSVHHPQGNEKSISFFDAPAESESTQIDGADRDVWRVVWSDGTTEPGSSGSGLWDQNQQVVGLLSGGAASCFDQTAPDFYGRLNVAWQEEGTCDRQLKFWLDPDSSGALQLDGVGIGSAAPQVPACTPGTPVSTPVPSATPTPSPSVTPGATPTATPSPSPAPTSEPAPRSGSGALGLWGLLLLIAHGFRMRGSNRR